MNRIEIVIAVKPDKRDEVVELLRSQIESTRVRPGCLECRLSQDLASPEKLLYSEVWDTVALMCGRIREEGFVRVLVAIDLGYKPPVVHLDEGVRRSGLDALAAIRSVGDGCHT